jgi:hypothetical protein
VSLKTIDCIEKNVTMDVFIMFGSGERTVLGSKEEERRFGSSNTDT